jgi:hypothetical protein
MRNPFHSKRGTQQRGTRHNDVRVYTRRTEPIHLTVRTQPHPFG